MATRALFDVPVTEIRVVALATFLRVRAEGVEVVFAATRAWIDILVIIAPRILARAALQISARPPVADVGIRRLLHERAQALIRGRILEVIEPIERERRFDGLDVLARLAD